MAEDKKDIELRSEKARNIVGKIPPVLLRSGISTITLIIILVIMGAYFMPYPEYVHLKVKVYIDIIKVSDKSIIILDSIENACGIGYASDKVKDKIEIGQQVELRIYHTKIFTGYVSRIYPEPIYIDNYSIYKIKISIPESLTSYKFSTSPYLNGEASVQISDKSVLCRFMESVGIKL